MLKKKIIFLGTRIESFREIKKIFKIALVITTLNSRINKGYKNSLIINKKNKKKLFTIIKKTDADFVLSVGFPYILPANIINDKKKLFLNIHPSLLPNHKGRKAILKAYQNKETVMGATLHKMSKNVDSGKILLQIKTRISKKASLKDAYNLIFSIIEPKIIKKYFKK